MMNKTIIYTLLTLVCFGCSNKATYEAIQSNRKQECNKLPPSQEKECLDEHSESYEEYKKQREELMKKPVPVN